MNYHNWLRPFAKSLVIIGILFIIAGVLACQNYPIFKHFVAINCELGFAGLSIFLFGLAIDEWPKKYRVFQ